MPEEPDLSHWPELPKHKYAAMFPRIAWEDRDRVLEDLLRESIPNAASGDQTTNFQESSRRLREAVKHDAWMRNTKKNREALRVLALSLPKVARAINDLESGAIKALDMKLTYENEGVSYSLHTLTAAINALSCDVSALPNVLDSVPKSNSQTRFVGRAVAKRLYEAWKIIGGEYPSLVQSSNSILAFSISPPTFEAALQKVGDHLRLAELIGQPTFEARSMISWLRKNVDPSVSVES